MKKFKVELVKDESGLAIGVRAARVNNRDVIIALQDVPEKMTWDKAVEYKIPSLTEWLVILENITKVNEVLKRYGNPIGDNHYWSSTEYSNSDGSNPQYYAWIVRPSDGYQDSYLKNYTHRVRCVL